MDSVDTVNNKYKKALTIRCDEEVVMEVCQDLSKDDQWTIEETAKEIRMSTGWVRSQIKNNRIPAIRLGHKFFIKSSVVKELKDNGLSL